MRQLRRTRRQLSKAEQRARDDFEHVLRESVDAGRHALLGIRDQLLWESTHDSFEDYCKQVWGFSKRHANRMIAAIRVNQIVESLGPMGPGKTPPAELPERQARELADLSDEQIADVVTTAANEAKTDDDGQPILTSKGLREAKAKVVGADVIEGECEPHTEEPEQEFWEQCADKHAEALKLLTQVGKLMRDIAKDDSCTYLDHAISRIESTITQLRAAIRQTTPVAVNGKGIVTRVQQQIKEGQIDLDDPVAQVFEKYREYHDKAKLGDKGRRLISQRMSEGYTVQDLCQAIDGNHASPFHCGENKEGKKYQSLELIMRDSEHVTQFIEAWQDRGNSVLSQTTRRNARAAQNFANMDVSRFE